MVAPCLGIVSSVLVACALSVFFASFFAFTWSRVPEPLSVWGAFCHVGRYSLAVSPVASFPHFSRCAPFLLSLSGGWSTCGPRPHAYSRRLESTYYSSLFAWSSSSCFFHTPTTGLVRLCVPLLFDLAAGPHLALLAALGSGSHTALQSWSFSSNGIVFSGVATLAARPSHQSTHHATSHSGRAPRL